MASIVTVPSVCCTRVISSFHVGSRSRRGVRAGSLPSEGSAVLSSEIAGVSGASFIAEEGKIGHGINGGNGRLVSKVDDGKLEKEKDKEKDILEPLWDDGYGTGSVKDYLDIAREMIKPDGGPPRWFCPVDCGRPMKDSPLLLFLPGMDGVGFGLVSHHRALGKVFEVRCMHIPVYDRTSFEGLVEFVESTIRREHSLSPNKPIYIVGDSFGGCLALAVAARNPTIDLILILSNPATSFGKSQLQPLLPILEGLPDGLDRAVPFLLSFIMGDPVKMAMINVENRLPPAKKLEQLSENLVALLQRLSGLSDIIPRETLLWKLKLLKSAAAYSNSRLHAVKAEVLLLASGKDNMLPSGDEAKRLSNTLQNCTVRFFMDDGHTLLMEDGVNLLTVIKGTNFYRRSRQHDHVSDFIPPSITEFHYLFDQPDGIDGLLRFATCPVMLSTLEDGKVVRGLQGVPDDGPVLLIGYHMLMGLELSPLVEAFLREKKVMVRGVAHPSLFMIEVDSSLQFSRFNWLKVFGAIPASARNLFKLLSTKSYALLYPGGAREALHRKGEEYKLFWPDQPEFVRMAARFGATIIPFGVIGEDDIAELVLDYNDIMRIPLLGDWVRERNKIVKNIRADSSGEVVNQDLFLPGVLPKIPGRFYYLFGKPIKTKGMEEQLKNRANANELYLQVKSEIERMIAFLQRKREEDPYRGIVERTIYRAVSAPVDQVPTFDP